MIVEDVRMAVVIAVGAGCGVWCFCALPTDVGTSGLLTKQVLSTGAGVLACAYTYFLSEGFWLAGARPDP